VVEAPSYLDALNGLPGVKAGWVGRIAGLPVEVDRDQAMCRLRSFHEESVKAAYGKSIWWRAEQVHGSGVAVVPTANLWMAGDGMPVVPGVDGLLTAGPGEVLGIYVADCGAIWMADRGSGAVGLLHSGKKGTELEILGVAVERMKREFGTRPEDLVVVLGPCIRPPDYEIDFAAEIGRQALAAGVGHFEDCRQNTAGDPEGCYSYRMEKGKTGRMLALIAGGCGA
jgi:hypothetical protein